MLSGSVKGITVRGKHVVVTRVGCVLSTKFSSKQDRVSEASGFEFTNQIGLNDQVFAMCGVEVTIELHFRERSIRDQNFFTRIKVLIELFEISVLSRNIST